MANLPTVKTGAVFSVVFGWLLWPIFFTGRSFDCHGLRLRVDACATKALDFAAVVDVFNRLSIVHSFWSRLFILRLLSSSDSQTLLNSRYTGPTGPCSSSIDMSCDPHQYSSVFMSENYFSTLATYAILSISESHWSLKNSVVIAISPWTLLSSYTLTSSSQMSLASLYVNAKSATGWLSALAIDATVQALLRFHANKLFCSSSDAFSMFVILGHFGDPSMINII